MNELEMLENALASLRRGETRFCLPWENSIEEAISRVEAELEELAVAA